MKKKSKILTIVVSIIALVCLISGVSYAYIMLGVSQTTVNVIGTNCVKVSIEDVTDAITMDKAYPISDEEGASTDGYTFKLTNTCNMAVDYSVNLDILNVKDGEKITPLSDIAIKLDDNEKAILGNLVSVDGTYQGDDYTVNDAKNLTSGTLAPNHSKTYTVRMWLDENASNESQSTNFYSKIAINGTPNNIIAVLPTKSEMYLTADNEEISDLASTNNYVHHSQITLTCEGNDSTCYINTSKDIDFTGSILQVCGSNEPFEDCTPSGIFSGFNPNTWYQIDNVATIDSKDDETEEVIVRFTSCIGVVCSDEAIVTLPKLDRTAPTINLLSTSANTNSAIVDVTASDDESGVSSITVKYGETEGTYTTEAEKTSNGYELKNLTNNKTYYYEITAIDKVGNKSTQTGSVRTNDISYPGVAYTAFDKSGNTLESAEYAYSAKVEVTFSDSLEHYIKVTDSVNLNALSTTTCGSGYIPTTCSEDTTSTLQNGVWYKVSENKVIEFTSENTSNAKVVAITSDGRNYSDSREVTVAKIDRTNPSIQAGNVTTTSNSITIPLTTSDNGTISSVTCVYGTSTSYGSNGEANSGQCKLSGLANGTTYYYKVTITDTAGNSSEITGSADTGSITTPTVTMTGYNKSGSVVSAQNGYFYKETAAVSYTTTNVSSPVRFVKTSIAAASNVSSIEACGTGTNPGTCTSSVTTSFAANTWYKVGSNVTLTYETNSTSTGTVYALLYDGNNYSTSGTGNISKIDRTAPSVTLNSASLTTTSITVPITSSDSGAQLSSATCKYSDTNGSYTNTASTQSTSSCVMTGLANNKTYYYQVVITDKLGNSTTKTGSAKTGTMSTPTISLKGYNTSNSEISVQNGYFYKEVATVNFTASGLTTVGYYIKSSQAATSSVSAYSCGNGTNPGSCSTSATTSLSAGYWYKVNNTSLTVTYQTATTSTGTLNAVIYDGATYSTTASGTISKIDRTAPTLTLGDSTSDATTIKIPISTFKDAESGPGSISSCKYGTSTSYGSNGSISGTSSCTLKDLSSGTTYYYQICGIDKVGNQTCQTGSKATAAPTNFKVGDFVKMTPTSTSYKPDSTLTGYTGTQNTINPSELNLWRVIRINSDNTVDMVSQYVSSETVYFYGKTGYMKFVGTLNTIAKQYANSSYTTSTRYLGYNGQIENCTSSSSSACPADTQYETDTNLVTTAVGNLIGYKVNATSTAQYYWLASRRYVSSANLRVRRVNEGGNINSYDGLMDGGTESNYSRALRPIVTLKSGLSATGSGTSSSPYVLN